MTKRWNSNCKKKNKMLVRMMATSCFYYSLDLHVKLKVRNKREKKKIKIYLAPPPQVRKLENSHNTL